MELTASDLLERLAHHKTLGSAPRAELEWLVAHGTLRHLEAGQILSAKAVRVEGLYIVLAGRIAIFVDRGAGRHKIMEWRDGDVTGLLPFSRMVNPPGDTVVQEPVTILSIHQDHLRELTRECHVVTSILVHIMLDRARHFTSSDLHDEKMVSLGKLSAGLAHELNNPAAAIERSATVLDDRLEEAEMAARALGAARLTDAQLAALDHVRSSCLATRERGVRSPIQQAEREDEIADWLADHRVDTTLAEPLADTAVTIEALDRLASAVDGPPLAAVLRWAAAGCSVRSLAEDIKDAAIRISGLVSAIKGFTHMDQAAVAEPLNLVKGLDNTIAVLRSKARGKAATVAVDVEPDLPQVRGFAGELNQIWVNLIDNALDAIPNAGRIDVQARRDGSHVTVHIIDNGSGIPAGVKERIFDPFFTTKPVGQGTGLGLDIVRRLVRHNDGEIYVDSQPGRTEFRVVLPMADAAPGGTSS